MTTTHAPARSSGFAGRMRALGRLTSPITRPLAGHRIFPLWAVLRHRGRRSGRQYAIPVAVRVSPNAFVIALPWGDQTQWLRNVVAANGCVIRWRGVDHVVDEPEVLGLEDAADAFRPIQHWILRRAGVSRVVRLHRAR
ncbi:MAG: hypothetical protein ABIZ34_08430 [Candidatus Limnocylindrales bacterium]